MWWKNSWTIECTFVTWKRDKCMVTGLWMEYAWVCFDNICGSEAISSYIPIYMQWYDSNWILFNIMPSGVSISLYSHPVAYTRKLFLFFPFCSYAFASFFLLCYFIEIRFIHIKSILSHNYPIETGSHTFSTAL